MTAARVRRRHRRLAPAPASDRTARTGDVPQADRGSVPASCSSPASASSLRRRRPGQAHDRAVQPMKMAAAEALYETERAPRRSRSSPSATPRRHGGEVLASSDPATCSPSWPPATVDGEVEGINDARAVPGDTARPGRAYYRPATTRRYIPVTYWTFRCMIGSAAAWPLVAVRCSGLTAARPHPRAAGWLWPLASRCRSLPVAGQLHRLDLHRDGPPAVGASSA